MSFTVSVLGFSILALLLAGYLGQKYMPPPKAKLVGIDLGTTFSCLGLYQAGSGNVEVLGDENSSCIPSVVAFTNSGDVLVGHQAVAQAENNPTNTIYDAKRFIGKVFDKKSLEKESTRYPFKVAQDSDGMAYFLIGSEKNQTKITPQEVGAHILRTLLRSAEKRLGIKVKAAVMSVPAEFNDLQKNYTRRAAQIVGVDVWRTISEPTAAALACGLHREEGQGTVLVVDLGGGTLDVSLLLRQGGMFLTQAMAGNNHLGGQDLNQRLFDWLLSRIEQSWGESLQSREDLQLLRLLTEKLKLNLSKQHHADIILKSHEIRDKNQELRKFTLTVSRELFEQLCSDLFDRVLEPVDAVLKFAELEPIDVDHVVLVGGSTRVPRVRQLIAEYFGKPPLTNVNPDEAVAIGTGIQAGILGDMWPVKVSATEVPSSVGKINIS